MESTVRKVRCNMNLTKHKLQEQRFAMGEGRATEMQPPEQNDGYLTDDLFESISSTPMGRLLTMISALPEVRHEKVNGVRRQITDDNYDITRNLDTALDRVLEEFLLES
ncbi:MAG: flagellar biosynthesis anti-sigma factor FlgM [Planctomycetes bacterium]|nr:flagellar biosynthesis anti-sigma factor FlgM [Planctomycetota bacterium]